MALSIINEQADKLTREFAAMQKVSLSEAIIIAMSEAIERRLHTETPLETAAKIRAKYNITLTDQARQPLPKEVYDKMWGQ